LVLGNDIERPWRRALGLRRRADHGDREALQPDLVRRVEGDELALADARPRLAPRGCRVSIDERLRVADARPRGRDELPDRRLRRPSPRRRHAPLRRLTLLDREALNARPAELHGLRVEDARRERGSLLAAQDAIFLNLAHQDEARRAVAREDLNPLAALPAGL